MLRDANITCPEKNCFINIDGQYGNSMKNMVIKSVQGMDNIYLYCESYYDYLMNKSQNGDPRGDELDRYTQTKTTCFENGAAPRIYCYGNYRYSCKLAWIEDEEIWDTSPTPEPTPLPTIELRPASPSPMIHDTNIIAIIIILAACVLLFCICSLMQRRRRKRRKKSLTTFIGNPLIIAVSIGEYDKDPSNPDITHLQFPDLTSIDKDIKNLMELFVDTLNYTLTPKYVLENVNTH